MSTTDTPAPSSTRFTSRVADAIARRGRGLTLANIATQAGIIVTGGVVRLTGSGLGCSTWPQCEPGSFVPVEHEATSYHQFIEFGNRTLTFLLAAVALLLAIAVWRSRPDLKWWGLVPGIGVILQAVVGGITVLVELHPLVVGPHLLLSTALVWFSTWLALEYRRAPRRSGTGLRWELAASSLLLVAVLVLGALTTGAGPHSGDAEATERLALDPALIARVHAMSVWAFVLVLGWIIWKVRNDRSVGERDEVRKAWVVLAAVTLSQGAIGYAQYFTGLPEVLVALHLVGIGALTAAHAAFHYLLKARES